MIDFAPLGQAIGNLSTIGQREEAQKLLNAQLDAALAAQGQAPAAQAQTPLAALGTPPQQPAASRALPTFAQGTDIGRFASAIQSNESGGKYGIVGPIHKKYGRALGAYQVMESNLPSWSKEAIGREVSPDEFLRSPQIQDAIFEKKFGQAVAKYGNPQDAASVWFTGRPLAQGANAKDVLGTTGAEYVRRFNSALGRAPAGSAPALPATAMQMPGGGQPAPASAPTAPVQVASAQADVPASGAQPIGFNVPGQGGGDFVPGTEASPALAQSRGAAAPAAAGGLSPAASQRLSPAQADNLRAMLRNPLTQGHAAKIIEGLNNPDEFSFQVVGDQLVRTSKSGRAEVVPNITKPVQYQTFKGSDGNDYVFNPQTGQTTRAIEGRERQFADLVSADERAAAGVDPAYRGPVQRGPNGELKFPGKAATEVNIGAENAGAKATATESAKAVVERFKTIGTVGESARSDIPLIGEIRELGGAIGTGGIAALQAKLGEYGIKTEGSGKIEAYNALLDRLTPAQRIEGAGATSDFDARMFKGSLPRLINTPEGNALVADTLEAVAKDRVERGEIANLVLLGEQQGGISAQEGFKRLKALPSIQTGFVSRMKELRAGGKLGSSASGEPSGEVGRAAPDTLRKQAQDAIARGAPRDQVMERLRSKGFSVEGL
ncbi:hypothetical protein [Methylorubrum aminovorans]|uniref:hypothetical protein n=1 Tax=Methylorubrum aminovorans TaxID=269069 RepID=UPI0024E1498A|nr:hypothetical protein [Methylorubrum aminovorans]